MAIRIQEPAHYRLVKAFAQKIQLRSAAVKGKAYRPLTPTELDDIASGASVYFVENRRSLNADTEDLINLSAWRAARRSRTDYLREQFGGGARIESTEPEQFDQLWENELPVPTTTLDTMLDQLKDDRQRRLAELLANNAELAQITEDVGYKSWPSVSYAKRQIAKRLAPYEPEVIERKKLPEDKIESIVSRYVRVAFAELASSPKIVKRGAELRVEFVTDPKLVKPVARKRAKQTGPVDTAIAGEQQKPLPELWAKRIGFGMGRGNVERIAPAEPAPAEPTPVSYWDSPYVAQLETARYQQWLSTFAR